MIRGNMVLEPKPIEQALLHHHPRAHHRRIPRRSLTAAESHSTIDHEGFFNKIDP
jgi:hypothetical protein